MQIPKVLLVYDDAASLFALQSLLQDAGKPTEYELVTATSGHEALRCVLTHEFAVILLDVNMPGMDGFETAQAIHAHPRSASVPIIFITAHYGDEMHRLKAYQKGAADYLLTPVIPAVLQTKVAVFVEMTKKTPELQAKTDELSRLNQDLRVQRLQDLERINKARATLPERELCGIEALLFWHHPVHGLIAAPDFLPGVLDHALLEHISNRAIGAACERLALWRARGLPLPQLRISINLCVLHLTAEMLTRLLAFVERSKLPPGWLELDIPEKLLISNAG